MSNKLSQMTLEELWQLFPIIITEHNPCWAEWYSEEVKELKKILPQDTKYHHIGSTAVKGIMAKPTVDILIVVNSNDELNRTADILRENGYAIMSESANRISLNKGYTENGFAEKVFHLHKGVPIPDRYIYTGKSRSIRVKRRLPYYKKYVALRFTRLSSRFAP